MKVIPKQDEIIDLEDEQEVQQVHLEEEKEIEQVHLEGEKKVEQVHLEDEKEVEQVHLAERVHPEDEKEVQQAQATQKLSLEIPVASPLQEDRPILCDAPRRLLFDVHIRKAIIKELLRRPGQIIPFYNCGSAAVPDFMTLEPDIDISLLLVNKQLHADAVEALYGLNVFRFMKPRVALWWFQRIGLSNLQKITSANFIVDADEDVNFQVREERLWQALFSYLQPRQRFHNIGISFERWNDEGFQYLTPFDQDRITGSRDMSVGRLAQFRGIEIVHIRGGTFLNARDGEYLIACMMLPHGAIRPPQPALDIEVEKEVPAECEYSTALDEDNQNPDEMMVVYDNENEEIDENGNRYYCNEGNGPYGYDENGYDNEAYGYEDDDHGHQLEKEVEWREGDDHGYQRQNEVEWREGDDHGYPREKEVEWREDDDHGYRCEKEEVMRGQN